MLNTEHPNVFISYSWEDESHKKWVKDLADRLLSDGINATIDQYDLSLGDRLPQFMEKSIADADYVLIICTPTYKKKSDERKGGVGYEGHVISGELFAGGNERKFIPIIRKGSAVTSIPNALSAKLGIDLTSDNCYEDGYKDLVTTVYGVKRKPQIGLRPSYVIQNPVDSNKFESQDAPIHILGIITDEVTLPKMDGTRGCALYKIPFRLSRRPDRLWCDLFIKAWNMPPSFTTMHRPGIATVLGDKIILDGTTIEEVRDYHRETLSLCIKVANEKEADIRKKEKQQMELEERRKNQHYSNVNSIANEIEF